MSSLCVVEIDVLKNSLLEYVKELCSNKTEDRPFNYETMKQEIYNHCKKRPMVLPRSSTVLPGSTGSDTVVVVSIVAGVTFITLLLAFVLVLFKKRGCTRFGKFSPHQGFNTGNSSLRVSSFLKRFSYQ